MTIEGRCDTVLAIHLHPSLCTSSTS